MKKKIEKWKFCYTIALIIILVVQVKTTPWEVLNIPFRPNSIKEQYDFEIRTSECNRSKFKDRRDEKRKVMIIFSLSFFVDLFDWNL